MTWYAKELLFNACRQAHQTVQTMPSIQDHLYLLHGAIDHDWPDQDCRHDFPADGLIAIRPLCSPQEAHAFEWFKQETPLAPQALAADQAADLQLDTSIVANALEFTDDQITAITPFLRFAKFLSNAIGAPVLYYDAFSWGGSFQHELAWVFAAQEMAFVKAETNHTHDRIAQITTEGTTTIQSTALRQGLEALDCSLPSNYFAPHARDFPWAHYKL